MRPERRRPRSFLGQHEHVVGAGLDFLARHLIQRFLPLPVTFFLVRHEVLQVDAPMSTDSVERQFAILQNPYHVLARNAKQVGGILRTQFVVCRNDCDCLPLLRVCKNSYQHIPHRSGNGLLLVVCARNRSLTMLQKFAERTKWLPSAGWYRNVMARHWWITYG